MAAAKAKPRHVAIIMDGNGRWAKKQGLDRSAGHRQGLEAARTAALYCRKNKIDALTLFAFSTDNWRRPKTEIKSLLDLLAEGLNKHLPAFIENDIRLHFIGDLSTFPQALRKSLYKFAAATNECKQLDLYVALNYSGRWDIAEAVRQLADRGHDMSAIDEADIEAHLASAMAPAPDLLIRTSGELRLSNFMLWQAAYTELYFTEVHWPDFAEKDFDEALLAYAQRDRRFGATKAQALS